MQTTKNNFDTTKEQLNKQLADERLKKIQAVNKLAEIMNRKELSGKQSKKVSATELRRKEKECRKLEQELSTVSGLIHLKIAGKIEIIPNNKGTKSKIKNEEIDFGNSFVDAIPFNNVCVIIQDCYNQNFVRFDFVL